MTRLWIPVRATAGLLFATLLLSLAPASAEPPSGAAAGGPRAAGRSAGLGAGAAKSGGEAGFAAALSPGDRTAPTADPADGGASVDQAGLAPYDPAPAITLPTTAGDLTIGGGPSDTSHVLIGHSTRSPSGDAIWTASPAALIAASPPDVHYVFMSYADTPAAVAADIDGMRSRVDAAIAALPGAADRQHWTDHVHYVTANPLTLGGAAAAWLEGWGMIVADVRADWVDAAGMPQSLRVEGTTDTGWAAPLTRVGPVTGPLADYGNLACGADVPAAPLAGKIALVERGTCTFSEKAANAVKHGATGVVLYTDARPKLQMGGTCAACNVPVTMIDRDPGLALKAQLAAGVAVTATLGVATVVGADAAAVDHRGRVRELGTIPFPFPQFTDPPLDNLMLVAKEAELYHYEHTLDARLAAEEQAGGITKIPVYTGVWHDDPGWTGRRAIADVTLPDAATMATFDTLEVDFTMSCTGNRKSQCPAWDYLVYLYLCDPANPDQCNVEFGRWITPYWSGGRWVTDLSPMLALINEGGPRRFGFWTVQHYKLDMTFRLSNRGKGLVPKRAVPLLSGGDYRQGYNQRYSPMAFEMPDWAEKVEVVALITGHGQNDDEGCGEFCNHTHHFAVNGGAEHVKEHPTAGTLMGCADRVGEGVVPNQAGTWIFGRAGWCPGLDVPPWSFDITADVRRGGDNVLTYKSLFNGEDYVSTSGGDPNTPPANGWDARIEMTSWLVYSARPGVAAGPVAAPRALVTPTATPEASATPEPTLPPTAPPSPTPTATTAVPTPTRPTATPAAPTPQPSPAPGGDIRICAGIAVRVPATALNAKLSDPSRINGWGQRCSPNQPASPWNGLRTSLTLQYASQPYNPLFNDLVLKCGCR